MHNPPFRESQYTISTWAENTFGSAGSNLRCAVRVNEEMSELLKCISQNENHPKALEECADLVIVLSRLVTRLGGDLRDEIDKKMAINRGRNWELDSTGHGYHK